MFIPLADSRSRAGSAPNPENPATPLRRRRHLGAYGVCVVDGQILLVLKSRGPYTGLLDLPGGAIEFGETPEDALRREFIEETGLRVVGAAMQSVESRVVTYFAADDVNEELHHIGLIYAVTVGAEGDPMPSAKTEADGEDSRGAAWFPISKLGYAEVTPFAQSALMTAGTDAVMPVPPKDTP